MRKNTRGLLAALLFAALAGALLAGRMTYAYVNPHSKPTQNTRCGQTHTPAVCSAPTTVDEAINNMIAAANHYEGWYADCFNDCFGKGTIKDAWCTLFVNKIASDAGVGDVFSAQGAVDNFFNEMTNPNGPYKAQGWYTSLAEKQVDKSWLQYAAKMETFDIRKGDLVLVWDPDPNNNNKHADHIVFVYEVKGTELYIADGNGGSAEYGEGERWQRRPVRAGQTKKTYGASNFCADTNHEIVAIIRPNYANAAIIKNANADTENPVISDVQITDVNSTGYTISCVATDNVGVTRVAFPTWTQANGQDDLASVWPEGYLENGRYTVRVNISDHNNETGTYTTHIYAYDAAGNYAVDDFTALEVVVNGEPEMPEAEVIVTPVEYDAAADTMTFEISTNREDVGIAYYAGDLVGSSNEEIFDYCTTVVYDTVVSIKADRYSMLCVWLIDRDGKPLHDYSDPDYYALRFVNRFGLFDEWLLDDRENKINIINSNDSYNPNMYMEKGVLYYDSKPDSEDDFLLAYQYHMSDGFEWWSSDSEVAFRNVTDSGKVYCDLSDRFAKTETYEIAAVIDGRVYRTYYDYVRPDMSAGEVSDITWSPEQPGIVTFKRSENADDYVIEVEVKNGDYWEWYDGNYDYVYNRVGPYLYNRLKDCLTISGDIGTLDFTNEDFVKDGYSYRVWIRAMSKDIEKMAHGWTVYKEFTTNPAQNPPETNPTPEDPTSPADPTEPDTKPDNPATSPDDDDEDDDSDSRTITVTGSSADGISVSMDSAFINKNNLPVSANDIIIDVTKLEAAPTEEISAAAARYAADGIAVKAYYFDITAYLDTVDDNNIVTLSNGGVNIHMAYPEGVNKNNEIIVLKNTSEVSVTKDDTGYWIYADGFSPYTLIVKESAAAVVDIPRQKTESSLNETKAPQTADETHIYLYMFFSVLSLGTFAAFASKRKQLN